MPSDSTSKRKRRGDYEYHGMSQTPEYKTWVGMIGRCHNPAHPFYSYYGARGIQVCSQWRISFLAFYRDMGMRRNPKDTIDRINNDGNYEPENVRWASRKEQASNRRRYANAIALTFDGKTCSIMEWAKHLNVGYQVLYHQLLRHPVKEVLAGYFHQGVLTGESHPSAQFTASDVRQMRALRMDGQSYAAIGRHFGIDRRHARSIVLRKIWKCVD